MHPTRGTPAEMGPLATGPRRPEPDLAAQSALRRPMRLGDWTFVFGLPTTEREFASAKPDSDFCYVPPPLLTWPDYETSVLHHFNVHLVPLERLGLRIVRFARASDYVRAMKRRRGVVLFTHCAQKRLLEFRGGLVGFDAVARRLDRAYEGVGEICACAPDGLQSALKRRAPNAVFKVSSVELSMRVWMIYYSVLFQAFHTLGCDYRTATAEASKFFTRSPGPAVDPTEPTP